MTNPNNAIGTNGAFDGRTSPNALNDITAAFTKGIVSGWNCAPKTGMTIQLGGSASVRDVALAENNAGDKLTIDNRSGAPVEITLAGAPATNNRVDAIVAYVDNPSTGDGTTTDNPSACGIIAVSGTVAANPTAPTDAQIRSAITADGATGGVAYFVVLATVLVGTNVTTIGSGVITQGEASTTEKIALQDGAIITPKIADGAVTSDKVDWSTMKMPAPTTTVLQSYGTITSNQEFTIPYTGFMVGKAVSLGSSKRAFFGLAASDQGPFLGGIPFTDYTGNNQVAFCFPVVAGQKIYSRCSGSGAAIMEEVKLVAPQFG